MDELFEALGGGGLIPDFAGYQTRLRAAIERLAGACGLSGAAEVARFVAFDEALRAQVKPPELPELEGAGGLMGMVGSLLEKGSPIQYELVANLTADGCRFGYLTEGGQAPNARDAAVALLHGALAFYLEQGGASEAAGQLADAFALAFPDIERLAGYQGQAQPLLLSVLPGGDRLGLKGYFHTRLFADDSHEERVRRMLLQRGVSDERFSELYQALYNPKAGARFAGVGVDADGAARAKIYVRINTESAAALLDDLAARLEIPELDGEALLGTFGREQLADQVEVALAFGDGERFGLKLTWFFPAKGELSDLDDRVSKWLTEIGHDPELYRSLSACLRGDRSSYAVRDFPLHGIGVELPARRKPKVNLYLKACH